MDLSLSASFTFCLKNKRQKSYKSRQGLTLEAMHGFSLLKRP